MRVTLNIGGMHCKSCETLISDALGDLGVNAKVDGRAGSAVVEFDENSISLNDVKKAIEKGGYRVVWK